MKNKKHVRNHAKYEIKTGKTGGKPVDTEVSDFLLSADSFDPESGLNSRSPDFFFCQRCMHPVIRIRVLIRRMAAFPLSGFFANYINL